MSNLREPEPGSGPGDTGHNAAAVRTAARIVGALLVLAAGVLLYAGSTGLLDETTSGDFTVTGALPSVLTTAAGGVSLVLALVAARVGEVL